MQNRGRTPSAEASPPPVPEAPRQRGGRRTEKGDSRRRRVAPGAATLAPARTSSGVNVTQGERSNEQEAEPSRLPHRRRRRRAGRHGTPLAVRRGAGGDRLAGRAAGGDLLG